MMDQNKQIVFASQSQKLSTIHSAISASRSALMLYRQQMQDDYQSVRKKSISVKNCIKLSNVKCNVATSLPCWVNAYMTIKIIGMTIIANIHAI